jgi:ATP-binding cassette subfamily D (ALD) long-chain fatty acid import protein
MVVQSALHPALADHISRLIKAYSANRPLIQRLIISVLILSALGNTVHGLTSKSGRIVASKKGKGKGKDGDGKAPRVAVRTNAELLVAVMVVTAGSF